MNIRSLVIYVTSAVISVASSAHSQDVISFDRSSFGKAVWSQTESTVTDIQLELSIGDYKNEPIINYSDRSDLVQFGRSVGRLDVLTDKGIHRCTAFIVSKQHILTNYHCSLGVLENARLGATRIDAITFIAGYTQTGVEEGTRKYVTLANAVEFNKQLDYAVLEVIGDPSAEYGELKLASLAPQSGDPFWIIGHPMGEGQRVSREKCRASEPAVSVGKLLHTCDTLPGNSGSPVIDISLRQVVALHHAGSQKDSVNFAILMSEILKNSKVLTAYKAPISVQPLTPKITEMTACDTLYSAAAEAKACYAYQAYFKSCRGHSLVPIAEGYINEFCRVEETTKVTKVPQKTCSEDAKQCDDETVCTLATSSTSWQTTQSGRMYVQEAKKRGLTCGVNGVLTDKKTSDTVCSSSSIFDCDSIILCEKATRTYQGKVVWVQYGREYVVEAWKRGLTCGVGEYKTKLAVKECSASNVAACTAAKVCSKATYEHAGSIEWLPNVPVYVKEAKKRGLSCGVRQVIKTNIKQAFISQSKLKRQQLQYALKKLGYYPFGIDGLWGKGTASGFDKFVNRNGLNGKTESQVFRSLSSKVSVPSSFKQKPIILAENWAFGFSCSGTYASGRALIYGRKDFENETRYTVFYSNNRGERHKGLLKITGTKMRFRMESVIKKIITTGSGNFNSSYSSAEGQASGNCSFYMEKNKS